MITNDELLEFQRRIIDGSKDTTDKTIEIFQSKIKPTIKNIMECTPMVYNKMTFDELNMKMTDKALPSLEKWDAEKRPAFDKCLKDEIDVFFDQENIETDYTEQFINEKRLRDIYPKRRQRIIVRALGEFLEET